MGSAKSIKSGGVGAVVALLVDVVVFSTTTVALSFHVSVERSMLLLGAAVLLSARLSTYSESTLVGAQLGGGDDVGGIVDVVTGDAVVVMDVVCAMLGMMMGADAGLCAWPSRSTLTVAPLLTVLLDVSDVALASSLSSTIDAPV
jgi:hypothetical protein